MALSPPWRLLLVVLVTVALAAVLTYGGTPRAADVATLFDECLFEEVAADRGLGDWDNTFRPDMAQGVAFITGISHTGGGVAVGDITGTGYDDLYVVSNSGPNALYLNTGDGHFVGGVELAERVGIALADHESSHPIFFDFNGNGLLDLFVVGHEGHVLFENNGQGAFVDVTDLAGDVGGGGVGWTTAAAGDYTGNGFPDLMVVGWGDWKNALPSYIQLGGALNWPAEEDWEESYWPPFEEWPSQLQEIYGDDPQRLNYWDPNGTHDLLLRNNGDGTFTDVTVESGFDYHRHWGLVAGWVDINNNGRLDAYVGNDFGSDLIYYNNGDGTFTPTLEGPVRWRTQQSMNFDAVDLTDNGFLDWYVTNINADPGHPYLVHFHGNSLILNEDGYRFTDHSRASGTTDGEVGWSAPFEDFNHSSYWDIFAGNGFINWPDVEREPDFWDMWLESYRTGSAGSMQPTIWERTGYLWNRMLALFGLSDGAAEPTSFLDYMINLRRGQVYQGTLNQGGNQVARLFMNLGPVEDAPRFAERSAEACTDLVAVDEGIAIGDFTNNGAVDLIVSTRNAPPNGFHYFANRLPELTETTFIQVAPLGQDPNRFAVGARIYVELPDGREIWRHVTSSSAWQSQRTQTYTFGLGEHSEVERVRIEWYGGGEDVIESPPVNSRIVVGQGDGVLAVESVPLADDESRFVISAQDPAAWQAELAGD